MDDTKGVVMKTLTIDFETYDPLLKTHGMGWCFKYHYPDVTFDVLGVGYRDSRNIVGYMQNTTDNNFLEFLKQLILSHDALICHNALYDIGCLRLLYKDIDITKDKLIIDTMLLAKHHDQNHIIYGLDSLTKFYNCVNHKESDILHDYVWKSGIYQSDIKTKTNRNMHTRPSVNVLSQWCMSDMRRFPLDIISQYCIQDVNATYELYSRLHKTITACNLQTLSDIVKVCIQCKINGVRIDLQKVRKLQVEFEKIAADSYIDVCDALNVDIDVFNLSSPKQLGVALINLGYTVPTTKKGNLSVTSKWLDAQTHGVFATISYFRKATKVKDVFLTKLLQYQEAIPESDRDTNIGWLYPTLRPLGATKTGRFSSGSGQTNNNEISIHQIPARDGDFGAPVRDLFLPHEGEQLVCGDFSSQEPRLQVHYAEVIGCTGAKEIADEYRKNINFDIYTYIAEIANIERKTAKTIHLGLSYGMHINKLAETLEVTLDEAKHLLDQYYTHFPFMRELQNITAKTLKKNKYIKTVCGRKLGIDLDFLWNNKIRTQENKALSKLIQGSAADQVIAAMIAVHKAGLKLLFSVHDELLISSKNAESDKLLLIDYMCNSVKLNVPMSVECNVGNTWGEAK